MKKRNKKSKEIDKVDILMIGVLIVLGIFILFQGIKLVKEVTKKKDNPIKANIVIPVLSKNTNSSITLNMKEFKEESEYVFKVTNFRNNDINEEKLSYKVIIANPDQTNILITKNDKDINVDNEEEFVSSKNSLKAKEKQTDIYKVKIKDKNNIKEDSKVIITIES